MASRSEELRAHRFAMRRLLGAVVSHRSDAGGPQMRRSGGAIGTGVVLAALSLGVVAAIGLISPSAPNWRRSDAVIVEKETGARFVYLAGLLHPVVNYASARLIVGSPNAPIVSVPHADLAGAPRGAALGIPGAPDSLPPPADLSNAGWSVCVDGSGNNAVVATGGVSGGRKLRDDAILAQTSDQSEYLIWHNHRYLIQDADVVVSVPLAGAGSPRHMPDVLINAMPPGSNLRKIPFDRGHSSTVSNLPTGTVITTGGTSRARLFGLVRPHDIAILTPLQKDILIDEGADGPVQVGQQAFDSATPSVGTGGDWPPDTPTFASRDVSVCANLTGSGKMSSVTTGARLPSGGGTPPFGDTRVVVPPGRAVLVRAGTAPGSAGAVAASPIYLLTDTDERFPIADQAALSALGYADATVSTLPSDVLDALSTGIELSRQAAVQAAGD
jgi:type VII secretion protein EccB